LLATKAAPLPKNAFAFTFDDGFENNARVAEIAFLEFEVPATFYGTSALIDIGGRSWTDMIEAALEETSKLQITGFNPFLVGTYEDLSEKRALMERVRTYVKGTSDVDPYQFASEFIRQCGLTDIPFDKVLDEKLSWKQVRELSDHPLFTVGGHGHTHRIISHLSSSDLESEVSSSIDKLETVTGKPVYHYSYPEGLFNCFSEEVINCLRRHGIRCCPTAEHGLNTMGSDLFRLRRIFVL
jgi:peptidoglycan/xylan/chitin deacetylase (PgdA/CDA1 family)